MEGQLTQFSIPETTIAALDNAVDQGLLAQSVTSQFKKMFMLAEAMKTLRALLTNKVMEPIMALQNTPNGFMTDRPQGGYDVDTVRECVIAATLDGVFVVGNEFNIIASRYYCTKNGLGHKLRDIPGLGQTITPGIPRNVGESGAIIKMTIEWTYSKKSESKEIEFAVRVNKGMGADAVIGKATRKARAWLYAKITGNEVPDGDASDAIDIPATKVSESPFEKKPELEAESEDRAEDLL